MVGTSSKSRVTLVRADSMSADEVCSKDWMGSNEERSIWCASALDSVGRRWARQSLLVGQLIAGQVIVGG